MCQCRLSDCDDYIVVMSRMSSSLGAQTQDLGREDSMLLRKGPGGKKCSPIVCNFSHKFENTITWFAIKDRKI